MTTNLNIEAILKDFYTVSGIRISIHDMEFNEIYSYPKEATPFCRCIQQSETVRAACLKNDSDAFNRVKENGQLYVYKCHFGLIEAVAPIYHFGTLAGYIMMGQIKESTDAANSYILNKAQGPIKDSLTARQMVANIRTIDRNLIDAYINIMTVLAEYITSTNRLFSHNDKLPKMVKEYINKNYASKITLAILSHKFGCCNATLTKTFKKEYGISIMTYLTNLRLSKAEEMIIKSRKSFKEIAVDCGFYDQNYFSKAFTKNYGLSPKKYRETKFVI